jgi:anti-anti-sigma regulatory factor
VHDHDGTYERRLAEFFAAGLRDGLRVAYVSPVDAAAARVNLADVADLDRLLTAGAVQVLPIREVYGTGAPVDPDELVAYFAAATEQALADGFRGLRVSADATELVRTRAQQAAFARYEFLIDCYMADHPLSGLCAFQVHLGDDVLAEFLSLHAPEPSGEPPFQVFGCADGAIGLAGEFDPSGVAALGRLLPRLHTAGGTGPVVVDLAEVEYVDHRLLRSLSELARTTGTRLSLRSPPPFADRLLGLLPATYLRPGALDVQP